MGTLELLKHQGFKLGVISNSDERVGKLSCNIFVSVCAYLCFFLFLQVHVVENLKLNRYFDFVLASAVVGFEKPNKAIFNKALELAGDVPAENALHVGDDIDK